MSISGIRNSAAGSTYKESLRALHTQTAHSRTHPAQQQLEQLDLLMPAAVVLLPECNATHEAARRVYKQEQAAMSLVTAKPE